jgi:hypothetical protein
MSQQRIPALCQIARNVSAAGTPGVVNWQSKVDTHTIIIAEFAVTKSISALVGLLADAKG